MSMNLIEDYQKLIKTTNELNILKDIIIQRFEEFFNSNDMNMADIKLYNNSIEIKTNYSSLDSAFLIAFFEAFQEFKKISIETRADSLHIIIIVK